jgi:Domain of unknown function (DUF5107)/PEGA domain
MRPNIILIFLAVLGLWIAGCTGTPQPSPNAGTTLTTATAPGGAVRLSVQALPGGARIFVDGEPRGASPLELSLAPGDHQMSVRADGYVPLTETITLADGKEAIYAPVLEVVAPPVVTLTSDRTEVPWLGTVQLRAAATGSAAVVDLELWAGEEQLAAAEEGMLDYELAPAATDGVVPGEAYTLTARAMDAAGNLGEASLVLRIGAVPGEPEAGPSARSTDQPPAIATAAPTQASPTKPPPTATPSASATPEVPPTPIVPTTLRVSQVTIPTYPYASFIRHVVDPNLGIYPVMALDRAAYEASNPRPVPKTYKLIVLENAYLRLGILPELGGRLYQVVFKPTGNDEMYHNPVIKPTRWGPPSPPYPAGANWWLAAGGIEWGFPVEEHGYEWATVWGYDQVPTADGGIMLTLFTRESRRPYAVVDILLPPDKAYFVVRPRITNVWGSDFRFQWWANAMLAPGAANKPSPDLRFIFPNDEMTVHSTGDATLPGPGQPLSWPVHNGRDLSRLGNWTQWLGFFQRPAATGGFSGAYDPGADEGLVRVYPSNLARGSKGFAPGWSDSIDSETWTDDGSGYVELQGGLTPTFGDWYVLPPGDEITWDEIWYPVAGIGGVTYAARGGAVNLSPSGAGLRVAVFPTAAVRGRLEVTLPGMAPVVREVEISPALPFSEVIPYAGPVPVQGEVSIALTDAKGRTVLSHRGQTLLR